MCACAHACFTTHFTTRKNVAPTFYFPYLYYSDSCILLCCSHITLYYHTFRTSLQGYDASSLTFALRSITPFYSSSSRLLYMMYITHHSHYSILLKVHIIQYYYGIRPSKCLQRQRPWTCQTRRRTMRLPSLSCAPAFLLALVLHT